VNGLTVTELTVYCNAQYSNIPDLGGLRLSWTQ